MFAKYKCKLPCLQGSSQQPRGKNWPISASFIRGMCLGLHFWQWLSESLEIFILTLELCCLASCRTSSVIVLKWLRSSGSGKVSAIVVKESFCCFHAGLPIWSLGLIELDSHIVEVSVYSVCRELSFANRWAVFLSDCILLAFIPYVWTFNSCMHGTETTDKNVSYFCIFRNVNNALSQKVIH